MPVCVMSVPDSILGELGERVLLLLNSGRPLEAEPLVALELAEALARSGTEGRTAQLRARWHVGKLYCELGRFREAEAELKAASEGMASAEEFGPRNLETLQAMDDLGNLYARVWRTTDALHQFEEVQRIRLKDLGPKALPSLVSAGNVGGQLRMLGRWAEAEPLLKMCLEERRAALGPAHPLTVSAMTSLARLHRDMGVALDLQQLEAVYRRSLELLRQEGREDDRDILEIMSDLAIVCKEQKRFADALQLHQECLQKQFTILGPSHLETLITLSNIGAIYAAQGRSAMAAEVHGDCLSRRRAALGDSHPHTCISLTNLGLSKHSLRELPEARALLHEALKGWRSILGDTGPEVLSVMRSLAFVFRDEGNFHEATKLLEECFRLRKEKSFTSPSTLAALLDVMNIRNQQGQCALSKSLSSAFIESAESLHGLDSRFTFGTIFELGKWFARRRMDRDALGLFTTCFERGKRAFGPDDVDTIQAEHQTALALHKAGELRTAEPLFADCLQRGLARLGENNAEILVLKLQVARLYQDLERFAAAEALLVDVVDRRRAVLGADNSRTLDALSTLAKFYKDRGELTKAEPLYVECLERRLATLGYDASDTKGSVEELTEVYRNLGLDDKVQSLLERTSSNASAAAKRERPRE